MLMFSVNHLEPCTVCSHPRLLGTLGVRPDWLSAQRLVVVRMPCPVGQTLIKFMKSSAAAGSLFVNASPCDRAKVVSLCLAAI